MAMSSSDPQEIRAIPTTYSGTEFRSRTEARWALFFDELRVPWEYEREGYQLKSGWYVPDFWLPQQQCIWEVKGRSPTSRESDLAGELAEMLGLSVYVAFGGPAEQESTDSAIDVTTDGWNMPFRWAQCLVCQKWAPVWSGQYEWRSICNHGEGAYQQTSIELAEARMERAVNSTRRRSFWEPR